MSRDTPLTTLALFSVTHTAKGAINTKQRGLRPDHRRRRPAPDPRGARAGDARRARLHELRRAAEPQAPGERRAPGDRSSRPSSRWPPTWAWTGSTWTSRPWTRRSCRPTAGSSADLRAAVLAEDPGDTVSVATGAHALGAAMAVAAAAAGVDRIFLMGYDYRTGRSDPGATSPLDRSDGGVQSLRTSLDLYAALGVPADRLLLGLPLYGVEWPVAGPVIGAPSTGRGEAWFPRSHVELLTDPSITPAPRRDRAGRGLPAGLRRDRRPAVAGRLRDRREPRAGAGPGGPSTSTRPATLAPKMALANERGLAGAGFWAIGYERGLPGLHAPDGAVHGRRSAAVGRPGPVTRVPRG